MNYSTEETYILDLVGQKQDFTTVKKYSVIVEKISSNNMKTIASSFSINTETLSYSINTETLSYSINTGILFYSINTETLSYSIRLSQTAAFPTFAANQKEVLNLSSQEDLVPN